MKRIAMIVVLGAVVASSASCSKGDEGTSKPLGSGPTAPLSPSAGSPPSASAAAPAPSAVAVAAKPPVHVELEIASVANTMTFDKTALTVPSGAEVHLVLKNNATMSTLPHNWALVKPGTEATVAAAGLRRGDKAGYIDVLDKDMLVHTDLAKPGESADVTFTAPDPGAYPYICTVPGHYMMMKGVLTVTP